MARPNKKCPAVFSMIQSLQLSSRCIFMKHAFVCNFKQNIQAIWSYYLITECQNTHTMPVSTTCISLIKITFRKL